MRPGGITKAVVLAAGRGSRLAAAVPGVPKPLLPIDGRSGSLTFLDWHLLSLAAAGVREIYLVGNRRTHGTRVAAMRAVPAEWILNRAEDPAASGSAQSAWCAWQSSHRILDGRSRVLVMDADVVYDPGLLERLARARGRRSKILIATRHERTGEEVLVFAERRRPDAPRYLGKGLLGTPLVRGCRCLGEATGMILWEAADHRALAAATDWVVRHSSARGRSEHEDVTQWMMLRDRVAAVRFGPAHPFIEVDTPEDYRRLAREVVPRLAPRMPWGGAMHGHRPGAAFRVRPGGRLRRREPRARDEESHA